MTSILLLQLFDSIVQVADQLRQLTAPQTLHQAWSASFLVSENPDVKLMTNFL
jgi:hypothetical protein